MLTLALWLALSAAPGAMKLAAPGFNVSGMDAALAEGLQERFVEQLSRAGGVKVTSAKDIAQVLGLERQRQLLGCADQASCLTELAGALGVDGLLTGSLVKAGDGWVATVRVIGARDGTVLVSGSTRARSLEAMQDWLDAEALEIAQRFGGHGGTEPVSLAPRWAVLGASAAVAAVGGVLLGLAHLNASKLADDSQVFTGPQVLDLARQGHAFEVSGYVLLAAGGAGLLASALWLALGPSSSGSVSVAAGPGAATIFWSMSW